MKRTLLTLALLVGTLLTAGAMTYDRARSEALFLTDKMTLELGLNILQVEAVYEINLDYFLTIEGSNGYYGKSWRRRNTDLQDVLTVSQYNRYVAIDYFYRPVAWRSGSIFFTIYNRYGNRDLYYYTSPSGYSSYRGGHSTTQNYYRGRNYSTPNTPPRTDMGRYGNGSQPNTGTQNHGTWRDNTSTTKPNSNTSSRGSSTSSHSSSTSSQGNGGSWRSNSGNSTTSKPSGSTKPTTNGSFGGNRSKK